MKCTICHKNFGKTPKESYQESFEGKLRTAYIHKFIEDCI